MNINLKRSILRIYEITRVVLVTLIAEFRHQFTRYRRGPNQKVWNIDVVYLWSDPSDLEWSQKRLGVLEKENRDDFCCIEHQTRSPSISLDELRYSLRLSLIHI